MNRTEKFLSNSFFALILQIVTFTCGLIGPRLILTTYGSEINGLISSINQFIAYFYLVEAGLASTSVYALFKPLAEKSYAEINGVLSATKKYYQVSGYIFLSLVLGMALIYPHITLVTSLSPLNVGVLVVILGLSGVFQFFVMAKYRALLTADQRQYIISIASIISIILNTTIIAIGCSFHMSILILRGLCLLSIFTPALIMHVYVSKMYKFVNYNVAPNNSALKGRRIVLSNEIFGTINAGAPLIILTFCTTLLDVSVYTTYDIVIKGIGGLCGFFVLALSASLGEIIANNDQEKLESTFDEFEHVFYSFITWLFSCTMVLILPFIEIYTKGVRDTKYMLPLVAILITINAFISQLYSPQAILVRAGGKFKEVRFQTFVQATLTVVFGIALTLKYGMIGVLIASIFANIYRVFIIIRKVQVKMLPLSSGKTYKRILFSFCSFFLICIPFKIGYKPGLQIGSDSLSQWIVYSIAVSIYGLLIVFIMNYNLDKTVSRKVAIRIKYLINKLLKREVIT